MTSRTKGPMTGGRMPDSDRRLVCVGTYTAESGGRGQGIHVYWQDRQSGRLTENGLVETASPSWLVWHPVLPILYAANEVTCGRVSAFRLKDAGRFEQIDERPSGGSDPCQLALTPDGRRLLCANYTSGTLQCLAVNASGGFHGTPTIIQHRSFHGEGRQAGPRVHMVSVTVDGRYASAVDLGADEIVTYRMSQAPGPTPASDLTPVTVTTLPPGTGPRQLIREPGTGRAFVLGELSSSVLALQEESPGQFLQVDQFSPTRVQTENFPSELQLFDNRLYVANRGADTIAILDPGRGGKPVQEHSTGGLWPRHFSIADDYLYVCNQHDDSVTMLQRGPPGAPLGEVVDRYEIGTPAFVVIK